MRTTNENAPTVAGRGAEQGELKVDTLAAKSSTQPRGDWRHA